MKNIDRAKLKDFFKNGSRPTEDHFGALIDSALIKGDDGFYVDEECNIGIGIVADPEVKLTIHGSIKTDGSIKADGSITVNELLIGDRKMGKINWLASPNGRMDNDIYYEDGRVGIGVNAPEEQLDIFGAIRIGNTDGEHPGTIRWDGKDFKGRTEKNWVSLTSELDDKEHFNTLTIDEYLMVGTSLPKARVHFEGGAFLVNGNRGTTPVSGKGTRLMWVPEKAALRAGFTEGASWDNQNLGLNSVAFGKNTKAAGDQSFAMGFNAVATGNHSVALGSESKATNSESFALGSKAEASGEVSTAIGLQTKASGTNSVAMGKETKSESLASTALGLGTKSSGWGSLASGQGTIASSLGSFAIGRYNLDSGQESSWVEDDSVFTVGDGKSDKSRSNSLLLKKKGDLSIKGVIKLG
ncbi:MAG: hypothetical protein IH946_10775, partial [Bacteroidetes bacterium]|nr:hypothetical protein [Bacteroidota bacterium]